MASLSGCLIFSHYAVILDPLYDKNVHELGMYDEIVANRATWQTKAVFEEVINANISAAFDAVQFILSKTAIAVPWLLICRLFMTASNKRIS